MTVRISGVIDHVGSAWTRWSGMARDDVRSAWMNRPRNGIRTSAIKTAKTASTVETRMSLTYRFESPNPIGAGEIDIAVTGN